MSLAAQKLSQAATNKPDISNKAANCAAFEHQGRTFNPSRVFNKSMMAPGEGAINQLKCYLPSYQMR